MRRRAFLASPLAMLALQAAADADYPSVRPGIALQFPGDFGAHPAFRSEWWYITGWVRDRDQHDHDYGIQVTFFRNRPHVAEDNPSRFAPRQLLFAHAAVADPVYGRLRHDQAVARQGFDLAKAAEETLDVAIGDWTLKLIDGRYVAHIPAQDFRLDLIFRPTQDILLEGDRGFSRKGPGAANASYYYSIPHLAVAGKIESGNKTIDVEGIAWFDHEWSSEYLAPEASGWDWIGVNFDDGTALMAFRIRDLAGGSLWASATLRTGNGQVTQIGADQIVFTATRWWRSPRTGTTYPVAMQVRVAGNEYAMQPLLDDQELDSRASTGAIYWEGAVRVRQAGRDVGRGYLELTGYGKALKL
jgi:predicted secreted hydrolase